MSIYEWLTDDDRDPLKPDPRRPKPPRRTFLRVASAALLVALLGGLVVWQFQRWSSSRLDSVEQDVLAAFDLWREAAVRRDTELLEVLLGDGAQAWNDAQRRLLQSNLMLDRPQLGLTVLMGQEQAQPEPIVTLSADLSQATVTFKQAYRRPGDPTGDPVDLQHTLLLRRQGRRWILAPPDDDYWGHWQRERFGQLDLAFREREAAVARRLGNDLAAELAAELVDVCGRQANQDCALGEGLSLRLESDPDLAPRLVHRNAPFFDGDVLVLPTPGLLGLPVDESGYRLLYAAYGERLRPMLVGDLAVPPPLPDQNIQILCFPEDGYAPLLYGYDLQLDEWTAQLADRPFRSLWPLAGDEGLILHDYRSGPEANRLRLTYWHRGQALPILDESSIRLFPYPFDRSGQTAGPNLLFQRLDSRLGTARTDDQALARLDLGQCATGDCNLQNLDGFPIWSPDQSRTLLVRGDRLFLGDGQGQRREALGAGFSPFWLDNQRYGYGRFVVEQGAFQVEIVVARVGGTEPRRLLSSKELLPLLADAGNGQLFVNYAAPQPGSGDHLLLAANRYATDGDRFFLFAARLDDPLDQSGDLPSLVDISLRLQLAQSPSGQPSLVTSDGSIPFTFSPDGRWLSLSRVDDKRSNHWSFYLHDIDRDETQVLTANHPVYTARRPYLDWSADGQWLLIVDDGFLQLAAPAFGYRRLVSHGMDTCLDAAWVYPVP